MFCSCCLLTKQGKRTVHLPLAICKETWPAKMLKMVSEIFRLPLSRKIRKNNGDFCKNTSKDFLMTQWKQTKFSNAVWMDVILEKRPGAFGKNCQISKDVDTVKNSLLGCNLT